ncbi:uncharacterized protein LOC110461646 [Mizuhopecten yessoensis]|uniref:uncharacterized protein LOC110461646 n=1 Tax=Mizuhopecten yessoensis TaxID=6573 RepID=UPI000B459FF7|nr:uncharacterized protein LOC110461646 [Mizuhopecten yessoensis]
MCGRLMSILILCGDVFDFIMDWVFYDDIKNAQDGLVFGPHDKKLVMATLVFCIIGTVTFITECVINRLEYKWNKKNNWRWSEKLDTISKISEVMTMITLFIEDLPQILINLVIASCREDVTNIVQIVKATSALVEVVLLLVIMSVKYCQAKRQGEIEGWRKKIFGVTIFNSILILGLSSAVFYLEINFNKEKIDFDSHGLEGREADRYLQGVDVFMKSPTIPNMADDQWLNITDVKTITKFPDQSSNIVVSVFVNEQYGWMNKQSTSSGETLSCYQATQTSMMSPLPSAKCRELLSNATGGTYITVKLEYVLPNRHQPLGDILYNYRVTDKNCRPISSPGVPLTFKYFKGKPDIMISHFFTRTTDLDDVRDVWKTGRAYCTSTAREHPKFSSAVQVPCVPLK